MGAIEWNDEMSVGIKEFDADHRRIIALINRLDASLETANDYDLIKTTLADLSNYCLYHFFAEEDAMSRCAYANYIDHKKEHLVFTENIFQFLEEMHSSKEGVGREVLGFLGDWLSNHILVTDKKYTHDLHAGGIS